MALVNCSMDKKAVTVPIAGNGNTDVASIILEIIPDSGYVVAARDFVSGAIPSGGAIASITLSDTATSGGPQNDGSYTAGNKVKVLVDFNNSHTFSESVVLDINPSGSATIDYLTPVKLQGTFAVPASPVKCTFVASNVTDFASSGASNDFYIYDNPGDTATVMNMTIAATSGDFLNVKPTVVISNSSSIVLDEDYDISSVETYDSSNRLTQVVYTIKTNLSTANRSGDLITFAGSGADIPGADRKIYAFKMDTSNAGLLGVNRRLEIYGDVGAQFRIKIQRGTKPGSISTITNLFGGTGYTASNGVATISSGSGSGATVNISVGSGGVITSATINNAGSGYSEGEVLTISGGNANASITIKLVFTVDTNDGIYVFDNSKTTIADIFEPSSSSTTYPSVIDQSNGSYDPATNPYTLDATGLFFRNILIPADADGKVYRFTIIPESGTTVDPSTPGIDTGPDPDVVTFDIIRKGFSSFIASYDAPSRSGLTNTIKHYNYLLDDKGTTTPRGRKDSVAGTETDVHSYSLVVTDDNEDFHLPNQKDSYILNELNYTETLDGGEILRPTITADIRATDDGFFAGAIQATGYSSHTHAQSHEATTAIVLTLEQRQALTDKTSFNAFSFRSAFTVVGSNNFFKIKFFTTDTVPVYKSQTIEVSSTFFVSGDIDSDGTVNQQNTATIAAPALNRRKLYINGENLNILSWGSSDMTLAHNLDSFAFKTAQSSITTLDLEINIGHIVSKFINSIGRNATYAAGNYSASILISNNNQGSYSKQNITTSTTHAKITVSNAYINARDLLPVNFDTSNYKLLFTAGGGSSSELSSVALSVPNQPATSLTSAATLDRNLAIGSGSPTKTFDVIIAFGDTLESLNSSTAYVLNCVVNHRLTKTAYQDVGDAEEYFGGSTGGVDLAEF